MKNFFFVLVIVGCAIGVLMAFSVLVQKEKSFTKEEGVSSEQNLPKQNYVDQQGFSEYLSTIEQNEVLSGALFFTSSISTKTANSFWDSFLIDVVNKKVTSIDSANPPYYLSKNDKQSLSIYTSRPKIYDFAKQIAVNSSLYINGNGVTNEVVTAEDTSSTSTEYSRIRIPRFSADGTQYLYSAQKWEKNEKAASAGDIKSWNISVGSIETLPTKSKFFANGYHGGWVGDTHYIVYLRSDGLFIKKNTSTSTEVNLLPNFYGDRFEANNMLGTTPKSNLVAITYPIASDTQSAFVEIFVVNLKEELPKLELVKRIMLPTGTSPFWPVFSPGGRYLSVQTDDGSKQHIQFYDLVKDTFIKEQSIDISNFDFMSSFNTGWTNSVSVRQN